MTYSLDDDLFPIEEEPDDEGEKNSPLHEPGASS